MSKRLKAKDFLKTEKVLVFSPDDNLGKAMSALGSSHDAAFVLDEKNHLVGAVNPYYTQFHGRYPADTKLKRCMVMPPKLTLDTAAGAILKSMLESKMYFLPVLDSKEIFLGVVSLRRMLKMMFADEALLKTVSLLVQSRSVYPVTKTVTLAQARSLLKTNRTSRLPVVDAKGKLIGLLTRFDLREALATKPVSERSGRTGQKSRLLETPVEGFYTTQVVTAPENSSLKSVFDAMRIKQVGSVILINGENKPTGVVAYRDIIKAILWSMSDNEVMIHVQTPSDFRYRKELVTEAQAWTKQSRLKPEWRRLDIHLKSIKRAQAGDKWFELSARLASTTRTLHTTVRAEGWRKAMKLAGDKLEAQL